MQGVMRGQNPKIGLFPILFTDQDLANRCRESDPNLANYDTLILSNEAEILAFLDAAEKDGCRYVCFDKTQNLSASIITSIDYIRKAIPNKK